MMMMMMMMMIMLIIFAIIMRIVVFVDMAIVFVLRRIAELVVVVNFTLFVGVRAPTKNAHTLKVDKSDA
jgi:hypothetical protein